MAVLEPDEPGGGDDEDVEEIIPRNPGAQGCASPSCRAKSMDGSFVCGPRGLLSAKLPPGQLPTAQTTK